MCAVSINIILKTFYKGECMPSFVLNSNLILLCCVINSFSSIFFTKELTAMFGINETANINQTIHVTLGSKWNTFNEINEKSNCNKILEIIESYNNAKYLITQEKIQKWFPIGLYWRKLLVRRKNVDETHTTICLVKLKPIEKI